VNSDRAQRKIEIRKEEMSERNEQKERQSGSVVGLHLAGTQVRMLVGVVVALALLCVLIAVLQHRIRTHSWRRSSGRDLTGLGKAMQIYGKDSEGKPRAAGQTGELKRMEGNYRRPRAEADLQYWLENMVWYHQFTNKEIGAATGLTEKEIQAAKDRFKIRADTRPERKKDAPLLVLPYPGGRHPRIGFLEGAIDPQRETKFSVFTPWDPNSYVVVDLPEAIWSNLGLTYLAHTHIDTLWTKQGIELAKLEWNRHPGGRLYIERELPNGIAFGAKVEPTREAVRMEMWLKNGTKQKLSDLRIQICVMPKMAAGFAEQTNENKLFRNPYAACRSSDGKRWIITAWENCHRPWGNENCPCFHSDPKFPDLEPGQAHRLHGWLSFYEGTDIEAEFKRIEQTGWSR
jgi:hypothetical protein